MNPSEELKAWLTECPLIAIIRGVKPDEVEAIGEALWDAGIRIIEVPLNSPRPFDSIERLARSLGERALVGAGTVLEEADVSRVRDAGGRIIVSPGTRSEVIEASVHAGLISVPGYFTPSEGLAALRAGAHALKFFPAEAASPSVVKAHRSVMPANVALLVVGSIQPDDMRSWREAGADGFGLGSGLFKPGQSPSRASEQARAYVSRLNN